METLAPVPTHSLASLSIIAPSISSSSSIGAPSAKAMDMSTKELCQWLEDIKIADKYIECFREEMIDGSELAAYDDTDLKDLGITEQRIRKKIMVQFRKIIGSRKTWLKQDMESSFVKVNKTKEQCKLNIFSVLI